MNRVVIIGAGFGGLTAAAELAKAGMDVTILEAHNLPGGCASTFYHKGFRFDTGATLAGGFAPGAPMEMIGERLGIHWGVRDLTRAMVVHLPEGRSITRWTDYAHWAAERIDGFGATSSKFWEWQEQTADLMWDLALRLPAWPPQTPSDLVNLSWKGLDWLNGNRTGIRKIGFNTLLLDASRPVGHHLRASSPLLRKFIDGQLLIASQTTSDRANALYGAAALDLPRRGVVDVPGGMVSLALKLVGAVERFGGSIHYHKEATRISHRPDSTFIVCTRCNHEYLADILIFNLPPWNLKAFNSDLNVKKLESLAALPQDAWGAFTLYAGIKCDGIPRDFAKHHQVIVAEPLGEGNSIFLSLSPEDDQSRAPEKYRALTISTHTNLSAWWRLFEQDKELYEQRKQQYAEKILDNAEQILPGLRSAAILILPGTPITFQRFTRRESGWVGGFPQTGLFDVWGPGLGRNMWIVGDTIFPGQSIPAVSLGGIRVANQVVTGYRKQRSFADINRWVGRITRHVISGAEVK